MRLILRSRSVVGSFSTSQSDTELYRVETVSEESVAEFNISGKATRLSLSGENINKFSRRSAAVFAQSEQFVLAETPLTEPIEGDEIVLDGRFDDLPTGRTLVVSGRRMRLQIRPGIASLMLESETDARSNSLSPQRKN